MCCGKLLWGVCGRKWGTEPIPRVDLQSFWGLQLLSGQAVLKALLRLHTWLKVSPELPVCVSPVAAVPRAGLGLFLTVAAAGAGRVALLNPDVAT